MSGIQKGITFVDGNTYNASDLNNLVDLATPLPTLITQWSQKSTPVDADKLLVTDSANSNALVYATIANIRTGIGAGRLAYGFTDSGSANTYSVSCTPTITSLSTGQVVIFKVANTNTGASTLVVDAIAAKNIYMRGAALAGGLLLANNVYVAIFDGTQFNLASINDINGLITTNAPSIGNDYFSFYDASATGNAKMLVAYAKSIKGICEGRLTLTTGVPVTTADVTAASTIYFTPYNGNEVALYDGTAWRLYEFSEVSLALSGMTSGRPQDIFIYDNSGTITLERVEWSTDTSRATAIAVQDGVYVKSGTTTKRYIGTIQSTNTTTTEDSLVKRFVWNYYNRVDKSMLAVDTTNSWTYTTAAYRQANNSAANQLDFVIGISEDAIKAKVLGNAQNSGAAIVGGIAIGVDGISLSTATQLLSSVILSTVTTCFCFFDGFIAAGHHTLKWLEYSTAAGTTTWYGDNNSVTTQSGISGIIRC